MIARAFVKLRFKSQRTALFAIFAVTLSLVSVDFATWDEINVATIYGIPLMLVGAMRNRRLLWTLTALLIIVTFVVYFLQIPAGVFTLREPFFINRVLDVVALLLMAVLLHIWIKSVETGETQARRIKEQNEKLEAAKVARGLVEVHESERRLLANHLHDLVGQKLTALSINLNIMNSRLSSSQTAQLGTWLNESLQLVEETTESIREVMTELRPAVLDDYGLTPALRCYVEQFTKRTNVTATVIEQGPVRRLPPAAEEAFFRIAQEALANVAKYARTQEAAVKLESTPQSIRLTIADDGCGFVPTMNRSTDRKHGWGLMIMRERAEAAGVQLNVVSAPGQGTRVTVRWEG